MFGRGASRLLIPWFLTAWLAEAAGQAVVPQELLRITPGPNFATVQNPEPVTHYPRFPWGSFGLPRFTHAAGMIFSGTVKRIARIPAQPNLAVETVAITLSVENAIRGAIPGQEVTISQWIGLWSSGQRYRVGERVLLFLYPTSKLGLTSCVGGLMGRFQIDSWGRVLLTPQHLVAFRADPVLGGKSRVSFSDFALAVRRAGEEE